MKIPVCQRGMRGLLGREEGQTLILAAFGMTVFLLAAGLGVDMGYLRYQKRLQQAAADSAAIAGASELKFTGSSVTTAAKTDSKTNGYEDGVANVTVTVNSPPADGPHSGVGGYVEVRVAKIQPTFFMRIVGVNTETITARAVAALGTSKGCIYTLKTGVDGVTSTGSGAISAINCSIVDDGNLRLTGSGSINAASVGVTGTVTKTGSGTITPTATTITPAADPLSFLTPPPTTPCDHASQVKITGASAATLSPGVYCGGIAITGSGNITFNPGNYVLTGNNGLDISGSGSINGSGVMIYNTGTGNIDFTGSSPVTLTAPTTGTYAGILFYQDPSNTTAADLSTGSGNNNLQGALYFPKAALKMTGSSSINENTLIIVSTFTLTGSGTLKSDPSTIPGGSPFKNAMLVE